MANLLGGGAKTASTTPTQAMGIQFNNSQYGPPIPVVYGTAKVGGTCIWYGDFQSKASSQKVGKGGGSTTTGYTYSASFMLGLCEGPIQGIGNVYDGTSTVNLGSVGAVIENGTAGQAAWSHLSGAFALGYSETAWIAVANLNLGSSASLPNWNPEVKGLLIYAGTQDANPAAILNDICTDPNHGINFPWLGDLTQYSNYCLATGLLLSPSYDQEQTAQQTLDDLFKYTNTAAWFSEGVLKVQPYGDQAVTGNGVTYTPDLTPLFNLGSSDYIVNHNEDPITITRKSPAECMNIVRVQYQDRSNTYHNSVVEASIDQDVVLNGGRSDTTESVDICKVDSVARMIAQFLVQQKFYLRNTYEFKLSWRYCMLEPMDIVTLTDANLGLLLVPVRITEVAEDDNGNLQITAEEFPEGIGHAAIYNTQPNQGATIDPNSDPGPVNPPYLFRGPGFVVSNNTPEIWCAVNGANPLWGAADIYLSHDGTSYNYIGTTAQPARYGALATALPASAGDPDTTNTPQVTLYTPGVLLGGSQSDADNLITLAMVDSEVHSYETATLVGTETYQLSYLRRGAYGSAAVAHLVGAPWVRLDDGIFRIPVEPSQIGQTIYIKFMSINIFGRTPRDIAEETAYTYVIGTNVELPDVPPIPANFGTLGVADGVSITWNNTNPAAVGCTSIERSTAASGPFAVLDQVGPATTGFTDHFTNGATYYYRARARGPLAQSGWSGYTSVFNSSGTNVNAISTNVVNVQNQVNNLNIINLSFAQGMLGWTATGGDGANWYAETGTSGPNGGTSTYVVHRTSTVTTQLNNTLVPVYPGQVIKATGQCRGLGSPNGAAALYIAFYDINKNYISAPNSNNVTGNGQFQLVLTTTAPANAAFATIGPSCGYAGGTPAGYYSFANFWWNYQPSTVDEVPDGGTYGKLKLTALQNGVVAPAGQGKNYVANPSFTANSMGIAAGFQATADGQYMCDGWMVRSLSGGDTLIVYENGTVPANGYHIYISQRGGTIANGSNINGFVQGQQFGAIGGQPFTITGEFYNTWNANPPGGAGRIVRASVAWYDATGAFISETNNDVTATANAQNIRFSANAPANTAYGVPYIGTYLYNNSGSSYTVSGLPFDCRVSYLGVFGNVSIDDEVVDGVNYGRVQQASLMQGTGVPFTGAYSANMCANPNFSHNKVGSPTNQTAIPYGSWVTDNWKYDQSTVAGQVTAWVENGGLVPNQNNVFIGTTWGKSFAANTNYVDFIHDQNLSPINPKDTVVLCFTYSSVSSITPPAGVTSSALVGVDFLDKNGSYISGQYQSLSSSAGGGYAQIRGTPPANVAFLRATLGVYHDNTTSSAYNPGNASMIQLRVTNFRIILAAQNQADLPQRTITNIAAKVPSSINYTSTSTSATISVSAFTVLAGSITVSYNAMSASVSGSANTTVTYYLYCNDPNYQGGSQTMVATTNGNDIYGGDGYVYIGSVDITFPASGSSGGSNGGGGSSCPSVDAYVHALRDGMVTPIRAGDVVVGDMLSIMNPSTGSKRWGRVSYAEPVLAPCARVITESGIVLTCSLTAPIGMLDGSALTPLALPDMMIPASDYGIFTADRVVAVEELGARMVMHITCEDDFFLAGDRKHRYVAHHNLKKLP